MEHPSDNIGIYPILLPDNKTYVFSTDEPLLLEFNPDDFSTKGFHKWNKQKDFAMLSTGATHFMPDLNTRDLIGLVVEPGEKNYAVFYRI